MKYRDSYVLLYLQYTPRFGKLYTHSFGTDTHTWRFRPLVSTHSFINTKRLDSVVTHQLHWIKLMVFPIFCTIVFIGFFFIFIFFLLFLLDFYSPFLLYKILRFFLFQCKSEYSENIIIINRLCVNAVWLNIKLFPT